MGVVSCYPRGAAGGTFRLLGLAFCLRAHRAGHNGRGGRPLPKWRPKLQLEHRAQLWSEKRSIELWIHYSIKQGRADGLRRGRAGRSKDLFLDASGSPPGRLHYLLVIQHLLVRLMADGVTVGSHMCAAPCRPLAPTPARCRTRARRSRSPSWTRPATRCALRCALTLCAALHHAVARCACWSPLLRQRMQMGVGLASHKCGRGSSIG